MIAKLRHFIPTDILLTIYKSFVQQLLYYGLSVWGQTSKSCLDKLLKLQKRALRLIFFVDRNESAIPLFTKTNILPINLSYFEKIANLMYDVNNNIVPSNIYNLFTYVKNTHSYNTRAAASNNFYIKKSRLNIQQKSFSRFGVRIWNQIPAHIRDLPKKSFKHEVKQSLFKSLNNEGYFINIDNLQFPK